MIKNIKKKGFTLLELIIVVLVLGILAGIALPNFLGWSREARVKSMVGDVETLEHAAMVYNMEKGVYPINDKFILEDGPLKNAVLQQEDGNDLYVMDIDALNEMISTLKYGSGDLADGNIYLYSTLTGNVYYAQGMYNKNMVPMFSSEPESYITNINSNTTFLRPERISYIEEPDATINGYVDKGAAIEVLVNNIAVDVAVGESLIAGVDNYEKHYNEFTADVIFEDDAFNTLEIIKGDEKSTYFVGVGDVEVVAEGPTGVITFFNRTYGGKLGEYAENIIKVDGGYVIVGKTSSNNSDPEDPTDITTPTNGNYDFWILKINNQGDILWDKTYGGSAGEWGYDICQASDKSYYVSGYSYSTDGDVSDGNAGKSDLWVMKLNESGEKVWDKTFGDVEEDEGFAIKATADNGCIVVGEYEYDFNGIKEAFIVKLNSAGAEEWQKIYGGTLRDVANSVIQTSDGGYMVGGTISSTNGDAPVEKITSDSDAWLLKLDENGNIVENKVFGGSDVEYKCIVKETADGGWVVAGASKSIDGNVTDGNNGDYDMWILKLDASYAEVWNKTYGGSEIEELEDIIEISGGGYIVVGNTQSDDQDVTDGNNGDDDLLILKLDSAGNKIWDKTYGGANHDEGMSVVQADDGTYVIAGSTYSNDLDIVDDCNGFYEFWVIKLDENGSVTQ